MTDDAQTVSWGPRPAVVAVAALVGAGALLWWILARSAEDRAVAAAVLLVMVVAAALITRLRRRLTATPAGLRVGTLGGIRMLPWSAVHRIELVDRKRLGTSSTALEIDAEMGDNPDALLVFSRFDLGVDPETVADVLRRMRTGR